MALYSIEIAQPVLFVVSAILQLIWPICMQPEDDEATLKLKLAIALVLRMRPLYR